MRYRDRIGAFEAAYQPALESALRDFPQEYACPIEDVPRVVSRMMQAFERGSYNYASPAIRRACKALGIKHTRKAIEAFLNGD